jgi:hypothetical protein
MEMCAQYKTAPLIQQTFPESLFIPPGLRQTSDRQTDTRSRSRQYIDRVKDWVEWTLEKPPRVKNSVLPRYARQQ